QVRGGRASATTYDKRLFWPGAVSSVSPHAAPSLRVADISRGGERLRLSPRKGRWLDPPNCPTPRLVARRDRRFCLSPIEALQTKAVRRIPQRGSVSISLCSGSCVRSPKTPKLCKSSKIRSKSVLEEHYRHSWLRPVSRVWGIDMTRLAVFPAVASPWARRC